MNRYKVSWKVKGCSIPAESVHVFARNMKEAIDRVVWYRFKSGVPHGFEFTATEEED